MTPENPLFTDSHLDLGLYRLNLHHHLTDDFDMWQLDFIEKNPQTLESVYRNSLYALSQPDLVTSFVPWLGVIAALGSDYEQACFQVLHQIESLLPPTVIARILDNINQ